jgi:hypothetical protein
MKILLVEPDFPIPPKSKNHRNFLPIGLLKLASYHRYLGDKVKLVRGNEYLPRFNPDHIKITSLFTYWSKYVCESVNYYKERYPKAKIIVGGIYASLMPDHCKKSTGCDEVYKGVKEEAEKFAPAYDLIKNSNPASIDYQIIHASRGCKRRCKFCGTWKIEPEFVPKKSIKKEVKYRKIVFYDNNFLANPYVEDILDELAKMKRSHNILWCESQSGFDGRQLMDKPYLGEMIKKAAFRYPRIAWDWRYQEYPKIKKQINILRKAGYQPKEIFVFMLYNWDIPFKEMEKKRKKCWIWEVQIADCRYRPLDQTFDNYDSRKIDQTNDDYYIHKNADWTDALVKQFRKNVRRQNICVRHGFPFYSKDFEHKIIRKKIMKVTKEMKTNEEKVQYLTKQNISHWFPGKITYPKKKRM